MSLYLSYPNAPELDVKGRGWAYEPYEENKEGVRYLLSKGITNDIKMTTADTFLREWEKRCDQNDDK